MHSQTSQCGGNRKQLDLEPTGKQFSPDRSRWEHRRAAEANTGFQKAEEGDSDKLSGELSIARML